MTYKKDSDGMFIVSENTAINISGDLDINLINSFVNESTSKINVTGVAIREGVSRNNIFYSREELEKCVPTFKGVPILKDHNNTLENLLGRVNGAKAINRGESIVFSGWISNQEIAEKIKQGLITEVSIGAKVEKLVKVKESDEVSIAKGITILEISCVSVAGVENTKISISNESYKNRDIIIEKYKALCLERGINPQSTINMSVETIEKLVEFLLLNPKKEVRKEIKTRTIEIFNNEVNNIPNSNDDFILERVNKGYAYYRKWMMEVFKWEE